jgi:hypothetical protein
MIFNFLEAVNIFRSVGIIITNQRLPAKVWANRVAFCRSFYYDILRFYKMDLKQCVKRLFLVPPLCCTWICNLVGGLTTHFAGSTRVLWRPS